MARRAAKRPKPPRRPKPSRLTPAQQRVEKNPLYDPIRQLRGNDLSRAAESLVDTEFDPRERALEREGRSATTQGTALQGNAGAYYTQLASREAENVARQQAISERTQSSLRDIGESTQRILGESGEQASRQLENAEKRGEGLGGGGMEKLSSELASQRARAATDSQAFRSAGTENSSAYERLQNTMAGARGLRGGEVQQQLANRTANQQADVRTRLSQLGSARGDAKRKAIIDLRKDAFENIVTMKGLGLKEQDMALEAADEAADRSVVKQRLAQSERSDKRRAKLTARGQNVTRRGQNIASRDRRRGQSISSRDRAASRSVTVRGQDLTEQRSRRKKSGGGGGGGGGGSNVTPTQARGYTEKYEKAVSLARSRIRNPAQGPREVELMVQSGIPRPLAHAAVQKVVHRRVMPDVAKRVRSRYGIRV